MKFKTGVLLVNLGTPDSPKTKDVRSYLFQFLNDKRVIDQEYIKKILKYFTVIISEQLSIIQYVEEDNGVWNYVLLTPQGEKHLEFTNYDDVLKQLVKKEQKQRIEKTKNDLKIIDEMLRTNPQNLNLLLAKSQRILYFADC